MKYGYLFPYSIDLHSSPSVLILKNWKGIFKILILYHMLPKVACYMILVELVSKFESAHSQSEFLHCKDVGLGENEKWKINRKKFVLQICGKQWIKILIGQKVNKKW